MDNIIMSLGIVAYNEEDFLPSLLQDIFNQSFPKAQTEILFINSMSTDKTCRIFQEFKENDGCFKVSFTDTFDS